MFASAGCDTYRYNGPLQFGLTIEQPPVFRGRLEQGFHASVHRPKRRKPRKNHLAE